MSENMSTRRSGPDHPGRMDVVAHSSVARFWRLAGPLLAADPIRNTLPLSIVGRLRLGGGPAGREPLLLTVHDGADVVAFAVRTPPLPIVLGAIPPDTTGAIVDHLLAHDVRLPGATGIRPAVEAFAARWTERTGDELVVESDQCLYRLGTLAPPTDVPGEPVEATEADLDQLTEWRRAAILEIFGRPRGEQQDTRRMAATSIAMGNGQFFWYADGEPVSLAAVTAPREGVSRIGPVYTPAEHRGHGYGTAVSATAAQWALDHGAAHVVLFADLANPVSNSIYQRIGFRPVADALEVEFHPLP